MSSWKLVIFIFFISSGISAQINPYRIYTSNNGLHNNTVLYSLQDKYGFIWFATINGLVKFDSHNFKVFTETEGLNSNNITWISTNDSNELYISNFDQGFNIYSHSDGTIKKYDIKNEKDFYIHILFQKGDTLYVYKENYIRIFYKNNLINSFLPEDYIVGLSDFKFVPRRFFENNGRILVATSKGLFQFKDGNFVKIFVPELENNDLQYGCSDKNGNIWVSTYGKIYKLNNDHVVEAIKINIAGDNKIFRMLIDKQDNVWFSIMNEGFYKIENGNILNLSEPMGMDKVQVNHFMQDFEGNIWVNTMGKGSICFYNTYITNYISLSSDKIKTINKNANNEILIGTANGLNVLNIKNELQTINAVKKNFLWEEIYNIQTENNNVYVCQTTHTNDVIKKHINKINYFFIPYLLVEVYNDTLFINGTNSNMILLTDKQNTKTSLQTRYMFRETLYKTDSIVAGDKSRMRNKINSIMVEKDGSFLAGTSLGLIHYDSLWKKTFYEDFPVINKDVMDIKKDSRGRIWIAGLQGIACIDKEKIYSFDHLNDIEFKENTSLDIDNKDRIWIGSQNGLYMLEFKKELSEINFRASGINSSTETAEIYILDDSLYTEDDVKETGVNVQVFTNKSGLNSGEINDVFFDANENNIWVATNDGASKINLNYLNSIQPVRIKVNTTWFSTAGTFEYGDDDVFYLPYSSNNFKVNYIAKYFSIPENIIYSYQLTKDGNDESTWQETKMSEVKFENLEAGNYLLKIRAKIANQEWGNPETVNFIVATPFTQSIYFYVILGIILIGLVSVGASLRIKHVKKKENEKRLTERRISSLRQQALAEMMNPHFIFNSLNSIQYYINDHNKNDANMYLEKFAKLIRMNLDAAGNSFILLEEEIKRLKIYLELESLRFKNKFSYELSIDKNVNIQQIEIPNMIIQPIVENAIWHGILPSTKEGKIEIIIGFENNNLIIAVDDNGIGFDESRKLKNQEHISRGMNMLIERLNLISENPNGKPIQVISLNNNAVSTGTKVIITLMHSAYRIKNPS